MYQPPHHRETRLEVQQALIERHPFGLLVTSGLAGLLANPLPFVLDRAAGPLGVLRGHLARPNPQWRDLAAETEALVVFQGPDAYVSPSWYPTKQETGKVVPTWNYAMVQVRGRARAIEDPAWLAGQVAQLTAAREEGRAVPWSVDDAPPDYVAAMVRGIVGIEIEIASIDGKWKVSQNRSADDRAGVAAGLEADGGEDNEGVAALVRTFGPLP